MKALNGGIYAQEVVQYNSSGAIVDPGTPLAEGGSVVLAAGEAHAGQTTQPYDLIETNLVLDTSQYASGDVLAITALLNGVARINGGKAGAWSILVIDEDDQGQGLDLLFFRSNVSIGTLNNAFSISDAGSREFLGWVSVAAADYTDWGGFRAALIKENNDGWHMGIWDTPADSRDIYIAAVSRGTGTYTASGIRLKISIAQD